jgi:hypothetical protein
VDPQQTPAADHLFSYGRLLQGSVTEQAGRRPAFIDPHWLPAELAGTPLDICGPPEGEGTGGLGVVGLEFSQLSLQ